MPADILIIDDEEGILKTLSGILTDEGYQVHTCFGGEEAVSQVQTDPPRLILLDIWMPRMDGIETLQKIKELHPQQTVVMMSGHGSIESAVKAIKLGAYDYIEKPLSLEKVVILIRHAMTQQKLEEENVRLRNQMEKKWRMVGSSSAMKKLREQIRLAAPAQSRVLVSGENGTGKELVARAIHSASSRAAMPFVEINCAAIPDTLIESELFGHEKGAFTGADTLKKGSFELADGGTLFLDEIGDMSLSTQAKVLRVIQEQRFLRVGGTKVISVDIRLISASNKDLQEEIRKGNFREDLFYRINVIPIKTPPLRERKEDIPELIEYFLDELLKEQGLKKKTISREAVEKLKLLEWKGNVRELRNFIERLLIMTDHPQINETDILGLASPGFISPVLSGDGHLPSSSLKEARTLFEKNYILDQLNAHEWNIIKTAEALEIERTHLYRKMKLLGIEPRT